MNESINKIELQGVIGVVKTDVLNDGAKIYNFSLCTSEIYKSSGIPVIRQDWHHIVAVNNITGEIEKGKEAHIIGKIKTEQYVDSDGKTNSITKIIASEVKILN